MSKRRKILIIFISIALLLALASTQFWRSPDYYTDYETIELAAPILTNEEYGKLIDIHSRPYIVEIEIQNGGALLLYDSKRPGRRC